MEGTVTISLEDWQRLEQYETTLEAYEEDSSLVISISYWHDGDKIYKLIAPDEIIKRLNEQNKETNIELFNIKKRESILEDTITGFRVKIIAFNSLPWYKRIFKKV